MAVWKPDGNPVPVGKRPIKNCKKLKIKFRIKSTIKFNDYPNEPLIINDTKS